MRINLENVISLLAVNYITNAQVAFGNEGEIAVRLLLDSIRLVLAARPPELIKPQLTVLAPVRGSLADQVAGAYGAVSSFCDAYAVADYISQHPNDECLIAIANDRTFRVVTPEIPVDHTAIAATALVYYRRDGIERIAAGSSDVTVLKISPISASAFADPTFSNLDDALDAYGQRARETACQLLRPVWAGDDGADGPRLVLINKPEHIMRESLFQALNIVLRNADVTREHMVDASKPVDIRVSWYGTPAEALIEIKWLGRSLTAPGSKTPYMDFHAGRAQEGANQLANYLDLKKSTSAKQSVLGYLVLFDARRRKIKGPEDRLKKADALAFEYSNFAFAPDHAAIRADFSPPRRWFLRPRESHFEEAA